ncbi:M48 family metallopeptidase [Pseudomonas sp. gcc21]|uniref:M48 family metallopeptidase n=1 Tax=Pseudomonas sp. gcc21 TaxID=2726989 RepID=UPI0014525037|nr:M48 family metallopeptidase [Pseudomonas sp. gcc21]QJD59036.1 M48 family metallopeptidase [Pseudomonas sp. gcc21]
MSASPSSDSELAGIYLDGRTSKPRPASVRLENSQLHLRFEDGDYLFDSNDLRLGTRVGNAGYYLHLPRGAVFETTNQTALTELANAAGIKGSQGWLQRLEASYRLIAVSALVVILCVAGSLMYGVPWLSRQIAERVPVALENRLGAESLAALDGMWLAPSELAPEKQQQVRDAFAPYLARLAESHPEHNLQLLLRSSDDLGANALALPGGTMIFTDDLIRLAEDDCELISIMAHEAGHVVHRDTMRGIVQSSLALWLVMSITGDLSAASDLTTSVPAVLANLGYSRKMEVEADSFALEFMLANQLSPACFANIMQRLDGKSSEEDGQSDGLSGFLSTHPPTPERIKRFLDQTAAVEG